jgi:hypothetical protein
MSDDENILDFGSDEEGEFEQAAGGRSARDEAENPLHKMPYHQQFILSLTALADVVWNVAGVFQPVFKHAWVFCIIYAGISSTKGLEWTDLLPIYGRSFTEEMGEEEDDE